jgi:hypothetical protein
MGKNKIKELTEFIFKNVVHPNGVPLVNNQEPVLYDYSFPFYEGLYSVKKASAETNAYFVIHDGTMVEGYLDTSANKEIKTLDLTTSKRKIFYTMQQSVYHFLIDDLGNVLQAIKDYPDAELIVDISGVHKEISDAESYHFFKFFLDSLKDKKIDHRVVKLNDYDVFYINDFFLLKSPYIPMDRGERIFNYFLPYIKDSSTTPHKKVFLSRRKIEFAREEEIIDKNGNSLDSKKRMDDEVKLERFFISLGFDLVYPEDFSSFEEQLNFFYSVKTIASLTSSGLSNMVFMQPGGNVVEVVSPLVVAAINSDLGTYAPLNVEMHHFYKHLAYQKSHFYFAIPNQNLSMNELVAYVKANKWLKKLLKEAV